MLDGFDYRSQGGGAIIPISVWAPARSRPLTIELVPEPQGGWLVWIRELPGCTSHGNFRKE